MLAQLTFSGTINLAQVFADIIGVLTGSITTPAGLSASFNAGSSSIVSTVAPGWTMHDNAAAAAANGVTPAVIHAPWSDDGTKYKNVYISALNTTQLTFNGWETWNSGTHAGTFPMKTTPVISSWQSIDLTSATYAGGKLIISASSKHIYIQVYTSANVPGPWTFFSEYTRDDPWNTVANGYPSWMQSGNYSNSAVNITLDNIAIPRALITTTLADTASGGAVMNADMTGVLGGTTNNSAQATACNIVPPTSSTPPGVEVQGADASKNAAKYLYPLHMRQQANSVVAGVLLGGDLSAKNDSVYLAQYGIGADNDTLTVGSDSYLLVSPPRTPTARIALKVA